MVCGGARPRRAGRGGGRWVPNAAQPRIAIDGGGGVVGLRGLRGGLGGTRKELWRRAAEWWGGGLVWAGEGAARGWRRGAGRLVTRGAAGVAPWRRGAASGKTETVAPARVNAADGLRYTLRITTWQIDCCPIIYAPATLIVTLPAASPDPAGDLDRSGGMWPRTFFRSRCGSVGWVAGRKPRCCPGWLAGDRAGRSRVVRFGRPPRLVDSRAAQADAAARATLRELTGWNDGGRFRHLHLLEFQPQKSTLRGAT